MKKKKEPALEEGPKASCAEGGSKEKASGMLSK